MTRFANRRSLAHTLDTVMIIFMAVAAVSACESSRGAANSSDVAATVPAIEVSSTDLVGMYNRALTQPDFAARVLSVRQESWPSFTTALAGGGVQAPLAIDGVTLPRAANEEEDGKGLVTAYQSVGDALDSLQGFKESAGKPVALADIKLGVSAVRHLSAGRFLSDDEKTAYAKTFVATLALPAPARTSFGLLNSSAFWQSAGDVLSCVFVHKHCNSNSPYSQCAVYMTRGYQPTVVRDGGNQMAEIDEIAFGGHACQVDQYKGAGENMDLCDQQLKIDSHPTEQKNSRQMPADLKTIIAIQCR